MSFPYETDERPDEPVQKSAADVLLGKEVYVHPHTTKSGLTLVSPVMVRLYGGGIPGGMYGSNGGEQVPVVFPGKENFVMVDKRFVRGL